ncbi:MAG: pyrimidine reductase [Treponema sp.]|nr:pyrimidine reductase [Treponema sp.]
MREPSSLHFDSGSIRIEPLFRSEETLAEISAGSPDKIPQKVCDVYGGLCFPPAPAKRPYTFASMVLSSDGKMAFEDDPKGPVIASANKLDSDGALADFWVLNMLRSYADAVIVGARTLQAEPEAAAYVFCGELAHDRIAVMHKKSRHPLNVVVSFDGADIPLEHTIFNRGGLAAMIATSEAGGAYLDRALGRRRRRIFGPYRDAAAIAGLPGGEPSSDLAEIRLAVEDPEVLPILLTGSGGRPDSDILLLTLRLTGVERLCVEAPSYMWHLLNNKTMDEMFINYSMLFAGGSVSPGAAAPFTSLVHPHAELLMMGIHRRNFIYTRQRLRYD